MENMKRRHDGKEKIEIEEKRKIEIEENFTSCTKRKLVFVKLVKFEKPKQSCCQT